MILQPDGLTESSRGRLAAGWAPPDFVPPRSSTLKGSNNRAETSGVPFRADLAGMRASPGAAPAVRACTTATKGQASGPQASRRRDVWPDCHYDLRGNTSGVCPECGDRLR